MLKQVKKYNKLSLYNNFIKDFGASDIKLVFFQNGF